MNGAALCFFSFPHAERGFKKPYVLLMLACEPPFPRSARSLDNSEEMTMDDDVIDITHMTAEERREHYRHLNQLSTCPCVYCTSHCARNSEVAECDAYQEWREFNMQIRGWKKRW